MSHRIALAFASLLHRLRRPARKRSRAGVNGPTVHRTGVHAPQETAPLLTVPGVGIGSCGIPASCMVVTR
ncbi:hypothetical protein [Streptomyces curacoi]|uniref:Uncharacterized protein n=1 Tax=Streptomyces curacoi TaxID=146536 RepID=A0A117NXS6_9ACTN|nr:hypothetical protein [Streptomyces curacoi]KUM69383.1 hypothetical protein AQI70_31945 [Streptomyces curacoi]